MLSPEDLSVLPCGEQFCKVSPGLSPGGFWSGAEEVSDWGTLLLMWDLKPLLRALTVLSATTISAPLLCPGFPDLPCVLRYHRTGHCTLGKAAGGAEGVSGGRGPQGRRREASPYSMRKGMRQMRRQTDTSSGEELVLALGPIRQIP